MSSMGWRTVVSCGSISRPARIPSNPVTMTSSGTRTPASSRSLITPKAVWSVPQTKACGSLPDPIASHKPTMYSSDVAKESSNRAPLESSPRSSRYFLNAS